MTRLWRDHVRHYDVLLVYGAVIVTLLLIAVAGLPWEW